MYGVSTVLFGLRLFLLFFQQLLLFVPLVIFKTDNVIKKAMVFRRYDFVDMSLAEESHFEFAVVFFFVKKSVHMAYLTHLKTEKFLHRCRRLVSDDIVNGVVGIFQR